MTEQYAVLPAVEKDRARNQRHREIRLAKPESRVLPFPKKLVGTITPDEYRRLSTAERYVLKNPSWQSTKHGRWLKSRLERDPDYLRRTKQAAPRSHSPEAAYQRWVMRLRAVFGLTVDDYTAMLVAQAGGCAICGHAETATRKGRVKRLAVDHDHQTGLVRGLLCARCNTVLGSVGEDTDVLRRAIGYLEKKRE